MRYLLRQGTTPREAGRSTAPTWRWSIGSVASALAEAGDQWHRLALASGAPPTALPLWCASLYEAFGEMDGPVSVHRLYQGSRLVAVLPLTFRRGVCRTWRPYQHLWYTPLWAFAVDSRVEGVGREIRRHLLTRAECLDLKHLLADGECVACLLEGADPGCLFLDKDPDAADVYCPLDVAWEDCLALASPRLVRDTRKSMRQLQELGELTLQVVTSAAGLDEAMTECLELEKAGWKGRKGTAIACVPSVERFYRALAHRAADAGLLRLYRLTLEGRLIAFDLSLWTRDRLDSLKIAYDEQLARQSPGNVAHYLLLERECAKEGARGFHLGHPTASKGRWTDRRHELIRLVLFADTWRANCCRVDHRHVPALARRVRRWLRAATGDPH